MMHVASMCLKALSTVLLVVLVLGYSRSAAVAWMLLPGIGLVATFTTAFALVARRRGAADAIDELLHGGYLEMPLRDGSPADAASPSGEMSRLTLRGSLVGLKSTPAGVARCVQHAVEDRRTPMTAARTSVGAARSVQYAVEHRQTPTTAAREADAGTGVRAAVSHLGSGDVEGAAVRRRPHRS